MDDTELHWLPERKFSLKGGLEVIVSRRILSDRADELRMDLEPFFHLPGLIEIVKSEGSRQSIKGILKSLDVSDGRWQIPMVDQASQVVPNLEIQVVTAVLTVWRVAGQLDALQVSAGTQDQRIYLQTGGARILSILAEVPADPSTKEILSLFAEPIGQRS